jgi:hypothetical protein
VDKEDSFFVFWIGFFGVEFHGWSLNEINRQDVDTIFFSLITQII